MDQATVQIWTAVLSSSGITGVAVQLIGLRREKLAARKAEKAAGGWRLEMEAKIKRLEDQSPTHLINRLNELDEIHGQDKREISRQISRLKTLLSETMDTLVKIQERLGMPTV